MKRETFDQAMSLLGKTWPDAKVNKDLLDIYWMVLGELHESSFKAAVANCLNTCTFFPKPAEIRSRAIDALTASGALPPTADEAWAEVLTKARTNGWISEIKFSHELITQAVRAIGGINRLSESERRDAGFIRKEFCDFYENKREQEIAYTPSLLTLPMGGHEQFQLEEAEVGRRDFVVFQGGKQ